jgi:hypothetical protein
MARCPTCGGYLTLEPEFIDAGADSLHRVRVDGL